MTKPQATLTLTLTKTYLAALCAVILTLAIVRIAAAQTPSFQGLPGPGANGGSSGIGISADGTVIIGNAGAGVSPDSNGNCGEAVSWTPTGTLTHLGLWGGGTCSFANGVNSNGTVIAGIGANINDSHYNVTAPYIWTNGTATILPQNINCCGSPPPPCGAGALGLNANATGSSNAVLVGQDGSGQPGCGPGIDMEWVNGTETAFLTWSPPKSGKALAVSANGSVIVGNYNNEPFRWTSSNGTTPQVLGDFGGNSGQAYAVNADGTVVVGTAAVDIIHNQPFRWTAATGLVALCPAAVSAGAYAVSADGSVVVGQAGNGGPAFRWTAATGCQTIQSLLNSAGVNTSGWNFIQALGISADGTAIVGNGSNGTIGEAFIAHLPLGLGAAPTVTSVSPNNGPRGSAVTVTGTNFYGVTAVKFGSTAATSFNVNSATSITATAPAGSVGSIVDVTVTTGPGTSATSAADQFTYRSNLAGTHDFNGDGYSDIAWRNSSGDVAIWLMNGTQVISAPDVGNVPVSWTIVGQRQLNNSGYADLIWRNTSGDVAIWLMNGAQILSAPDLANVPTSWTIVGTGPYNATNGYAELFWRNTNGDVAVWEINGTQILAAPDLGNVPPAGQLPAPATSAAPATPTSSGATRAATWRFG